MIECSSLTFVLLSLKVVNKVAQKKLLGKRMDKTDMNWDISNVVTHFVIFHSSLNYYHQT